MTRLPHDWDREERRGVEPIETELESLRQRHVNDPPLDVLRAARAAGVLPEELQELAAPLVANDAWTRTLLAGLDEADVVLSDEDQARLFRRIEREAAETGRKRSVWFSLRRPAFAISTIVAVVVAGSLLWNARRLEQDQPLDGKRASVAIPPAFVLPLEKPAIKVSANALTWRGTGTENPLLSALKPGLDAFRANDYALADQELGKVSALFPQSLEPSYYQGVSRLFLNDNRGALQSLSVAARLADQALADDVTWFLAIAEERTGEIEKAREHLNGLCRTLSERSVAACAAAPQLR